MSVTIGGFCAIRNAIALDYCVWQAIWSMLPICDEVAVLDAESNDGTWEMLTDMAAMYPKLKLFRCPWTNPVGEPSFHVTWHNQAREKLTTEWAISLEGDEIFYPESYDEIVAACQSRKTCHCYRYNFWRDAYSCIPHGVCCGYNVIRVGPANQFFPDDAPDLLGRDGFICRAAQPSNIKIGHYGWLRKRSAIFGKHRNSMAIWDGKPQGDPRMHEAENFDGNWMLAPALWDRPDGWENKPIPYTGPPHPDYMRPWLIERGWTL